jgi:hypothetical protein
VASIFLSPLLSKEPSDHLRKRSLFGRQLCRASIPSRSRPTTSSSLSGHCWKLACSARPSPGACRCCEHLPATGGQGAHRLGDRPRHRRHPGADRRRKEHHPGADPKTGHRPARSHPHRHAATPVGRGLLKAECTGAFYEAFVVKSKLSFCVLIACGAHLPRLPMVASFFALSWFLTLFLYHDLPEGTVFRRASNWRLHCRDAGSPWRWPATTFYPCRPTGRDT